MELLQRQRQRLISLASALEKKRNNRRLANLARVERAYATRAKEAQLVLPSGEDAIRRLRIEAEIDLIDVALGVLDCPKKMSQAVQAARDEIPHALFESEVEHYLGGLRHRADILLSWLAPFVSPSGAGRIGTRRARSYREPPPRFRVGLDQVQGSPPPEPEFCLKVWDVVAARIRWQRFVRAVLAISKRYQNILWDNIRWARFDGIHHVFYQQAAIWERLVEEVRLGSDYDALLDLLRTFREKKQELTPGINMERYMTITRIVCEDAERFIGAYRDGKPTKKLVRALMVIPKQPKVRLSKRGRRRVSEMNKYLAADKKRRAKEAGASASGNA